MHGLIFFYIQKFGDTLATGVKKRLASPATAAPYLPSGVYPDADAVKLLGGIAEADGLPLADVVRRFGEFLAPHLVKVAGGLVDRSWKTLDLLEHTESLIHTMVRSSTPGAEPPVLETVRISSHELHLIYSSRRRLCWLAGGLVRGLARHYGETITVDETSCMHRGAAFCSFVIRRVARETQGTRHALNDTVTSDGKGSAGSLPVLVSGVDDDPLPDRFGAYDVLGLLGSGAMGRVYLARDRRLDRRVAIKVMHANLAGNTEARRRFLREGRAAAAVVHPNVLTIFDIGENEGRPFIVMHYLEGRPLSSLIGLPTPPPLAEVLRIGREIAAGLAAAHDKGLVHRDVKPDNVFLEGPDGTVRLIDFGLARSIDEGDASVTLAGAMVGTPSYMPPERIDGGGLDAASDLFGLGVILYELLAGTSPFDGTTVTAILAAISRGTPRPLADTAPHVPAPVADLVMRLIAHDKDHRPKDAHEVAEAIAELEKACR